MMKRMTFRDEDGDARFVEICDKKGSPLPISQQHPKWAKRLAAYEDTGLTPEGINTFHNAISKLSGELAKYKEAEQDGRLICPPCKVGDIVYSPEDPRPKEITVIHVDQCGIHFEWVQHDDGPEICELWDDGWFDANEIGKTVFLTREEADASMKEKHDGETYKAC